MKYSFIVRDFYGILLPREQYSLVDAYFFAASHHFHYSQSDDLDISRFHQYLFWRHISRMMEVIEKGDFFRAFDNTQRELDSPAGWNPKNRFVLQGNPKDRISLFPDPHMFSGMQADPTFFPGDSIPYDELLEKPFLISSIQHQAGIT